jgi:hypothetical protein
MVVAPVSAGREAGLRELLETMNEGPGMADAANALLPFGDFSRLHFARVAILDNTTMADLDIFGLPRPRVPIYLAFLGECDGEGAALLAEFARHAAPGLRRIFSHCEGFDGIEEEGDLRAWLVAHDLPVAVRYVNWIGRTVLQVREEHALQRALSARVPRGGAADPQDTRRALQAFAQAELRAGRLALTPAENTPLEWQVRNCVHAIGIPLAGLVALPFLIVLLPLLIPMLRWHETHDPEFCPRPARSAVRAMQRLEDFDLSNSFSALGPVKPGLFRRWLLRVLMVAIDYACRHVFGRGRLARVQTIHFARWVFLDDGQRVLFTSNYDGSHESYMDDFINKVAWGLNLVFSNGFGWPRTDWLILGGARRELRFKHYQRRHQLPTQVWYKAYPGLTLTDLDRNRRIREGLERDRMSDEEAVAWLRLL